MQKDFEHMGTSFTVEAHEVGNGRWDWTYIIHPDGPLGRNSDRPLPSAYSAIAEGKSAAEWRIESLGSHP